MKHDLDRSNSKSREQSQLLKDLFKKRPLQRSTNSSPSLEPKKSSMMSSNFSFEDLQLKNQKTPSNQKAIADKKTILPQKGKLADEHEHKLEDELNQALKSDKFTKSLKEYCEKNNHQFSEQMDAKPLETLKEILTTNSFKNDKRISDSCVGGCILGAATGSLLNQTGIFTIPHEYGHVLAMRLFYNSDVQIQADFIDNYKQLGETTSSSDFFDKFADFLIGKDSNKDGNSGYATWPTDGINQLGEKTNPNLEQAIVSLAGSLPSLFMNSLMVYYAPRAKSDIAKGAMFGFALTNHLVASAYPLDAAIKSNTELSNYSGGHDFMTFSKHISQLTGISPSAAAISTAAIYTSFVPVVAALGYMAAGRKNHGLVSDSMVFSRIIQKASQKQDLNNKITKAFEKYKHSKALITSVKDYNESLNNFVFELMECKEPKDRNELFTNLVKKQKSWQSEQQKFETFMLKKMPRKVRKEARKELFKELIPEETKGQKALKYASVAGIAGVSTLPALSSLGNTVVPALSGVSAAVSIIAPVLTGVSLAANSYIAYKDSKDPAVPQRVKRINSSIVALNASNLSLSIATVAAPPAAIITVPLIIALGATSFGLNLRRQMIMDNRSKDLLESVDSFHWHKNFNHVEAFRHDKLDYLSLKELKAFRYWLKLQEKALKYEGILYPMEYKEKIAEQIKGPEKQNITQEDLVSYMTRTKTDLDNFIKKTQWESFKLSKIFKKWGKYHG